MAYHSSKSCDSPTRSIVCCSKRDWWRTNLVTNCADGEKHKSNLLGFLLRWPSYTTTLSFPFPSAPRPRIPWIGFQTQLKNKLSRHQACNYFGLQEINALQRGGEMWIHRPTVWPWRRASVLCRSALRFIALLYYLHQKLLTKSYCIVFELTCLLEGMSYWEVVRTSSMYSLSLSDATFTFINSVNSCR